LSRTHAQREVARIRRKRDADRKRERDAVAKAEYERFAAIRASEIAEDQAPQQQRLNGVAVPDRKRGGFRRADPLLMMHGKDPLMITTAHLSAARKFSQDYEVGELGASAGERSYEFVDGASAALVSELQLSAIRRYRAACDAMGPLRTAVQLCVLYRATLAAIAVRIGMAEKRASGYLVAGLDVLADHYGIDRAPRGPVEPAELLVDVKVQDIPQDRLGRKKVAA
jgi:hypothetical protein